MELVRELYAAENDGLAEPSGSQDMCGLIFPGVSRLDYDASVDGGWFRATSSRPPIPTSPGGWNESCTWSPRHPGRPATARSG
jgi:hypothetical protein